MGINLWTLEPNKSAVIRSIEAGVPESILHRLKELGFSAGHPVICLMQPSFGAPRVYQINQSVYSLDQDIAQCVQVDLVEGA
ncbi:MAG: FeoA family protein [Bdellovibrionales bacterium]